MMKMTELYREGTHVWIMLGRDEAKPGNIIDTNQFLVMHAEEAILLDPGGIELFAPMLDALVKVVPLENIKQLFASHQDPDIISSLGLWDQVLKDATLHSPWLWEGFIRHFGMEKTKFAAIPDNGHDIHVGAVRLQCVPAHYLHSSGNFHLYDEKAKILFSGDIGASLEPIDSPVFVEDFQQHVQHMQYFHQRWMPSEQAKQVWLRKVRQLDIEMMCPQHGRIFKGKAVGQFLDWFEQLPVGIACHS